MKVEGYNMIFKKNLFLELGKYEREEIKATEIEKKNYIYL